MDFSSALVLCRYNGNRIYRKSWKNNIYISYKNNKIYYNNKTSVDLNFMDIKDILALDWEIISNVI
jgi:hypothetical protein